jgi:hypothetical protein
MASSRGWRNGHYFIRLTVFGRAIRYTVGVGARAYGTPRPSQAYYLRSA